MNYTVKVCSSLEKVFSEQDFNTFYDKLFLLKNERGSLQLVINTDTTAEAAVNVTGPLPCNLYTVKEIYSSLPLFEDAVNCTVLNDAMPGYYPDLLLPVNDSITVTEGKNTILWAEFTGDTAGKHTITFDFEINGEKKTVTAEINVSADELPEQTLIHTNWFHADCLAVYYGVDVFSEEHWRITENFIKSAASHGVNMILTPVFTPALDTEVGGERPTVQLTEIKKHGDEYTFGFDKLDRWVDICLNNGIKYFEISHFFTQWGAKHAPKIIAETEEGTKQIFGWDTEAASDEYMNFLCQFGKAFKEYTDKKGITDICFVHCSDEPGLDDLEQYKLSVSALKKYFPAYEHIDALSDIDFYREGLIDTPVPGEQEAIAFGKEVKSLWTYYCCGQFRDELPNRFFCQSSIKNRILGTLLYKFNCVGFLQWGFNFYFTQYSKRPVDPFNESDAGGAFPSGDSYIVYPGENGEPLPSLRQMVFYDGIEDISVLKNLEKKYSREKVLEIINEELGDIDFSHYPMDNETFLKFAQRIRTM